MVTPTRSSSDRPVGEAINRGSDRRAMGCPEHFVAGRFDTNGAALAVARCTPDELAGAVEDPGRQLAERVAAGELLALLGDPRITPSNPTMIQIPGGEVVIGLESAAVPEVVERLNDTGVIPAWIEKECPAHIVSLPPYRLGKYPVTNMEYREFVLDSSFPGFPTSWELGFYPRARANHPVYSVSPGAADAYARWLAGKTGRRFRLPTEAEWEFAAAGPERREYPWGDDFDEQRANTLEGGLHTTTPVGAFPEGVSVFGATDLAGNVEEYVACEFHPYPGADRLPPDDLAIALGTYRVARGGSFTRYRDLARCKRRHGGFPKALYVMGFRLAEDV